jgi:hypothetical protein
MQQIIDCDKGDGDKGCEGGDTRFASTYGMKREEEAEKQRKMRRRKEREDDEEREISLVRR